MSEKDSWSGKLPQGYQDILRSIDDFFQQTHERLVDHPMFAPPIPITVRNQNNQLNIYAELPGIDKRQISLKVFNQAIIITVRQEEIVEMRHDQSPIEHKKQTLQTRERLVPVGFHFEESDVRATYKNGLLTISIPIKHQPIIIE
ncbi:Hsp20/alpha crystallin family protein [Bacillus sp. FJAT-45037]|uniref:Hsp20/alpha crystallin family protein n=1 Tax=Bacillus sp. FJAT-45037 TaxID=2011007 RepID=UPI0012FD3BB8|nr:Hsp20/alpha crystallin family protein [Bacillus sp. FJAT-45037]